MRSLLQSYRHTGISEVPRETAIELAAELRAEGAAELDCGWGVVVYAAGLDGECVRVVVPVKGRAAVVRWDAPEDGGRRVEMDVVEVYEAAPVVRGSNGGRQAAAALLARIGVRA
jgi:hypothetical protein